MILVAGATGFAGKELIRLLTEQGVPVRAMTRQPEQVRKLPEFKNAELVQGELDNPENLDAAFRDVEKLMLISPAAPNWESLRGNLIEAARQNGVKHVVYVSVVGAGPEELAASMRGHYQGEQILAQSGMAYTALRPNSYMQNFVTYFAPTIKTTGAVYHCTKNTPMALIDARDVGAAAAAILTSDGHEGKVYELTGPQSLNYTDAAARLSATIGRPVSYVDLSAEAYEQALRAANVPTIIIDEMLNIYNRGYFGQGHAARVNDTVSVLTGKPARSFDDFARDYAHHFTP